MNRFAIVAAGKPPRTGCIAVMAGALLGAVTAAAPAQSADLYPYPREYPAYRPAYVDYYRNCYPCGCNQCNCYRCGCCGVARPYAPIAERHYAPVAERHWVERDYWERRYPADWPRDHGYGGGYPYHPYVGRYPDYPAGAYPNYSGSYPQLGFGGIQYYPRSRVSYDYDAPPRPMYEEGPPRSFYEYEASPRPPAGMPGAYYNAGYAE